MYRNNRKIMNYKEWYKTMPGLGMSEEAVAGVAWRACRDEVLKILKQPIQNCDLSWEEIDSRFIEKIEKL